MANKTALVTGGTSGIGFELCKLLAKDKHDLVIVARDKAELARAGAELSKAYGVKVYTIAADLSKPSSPIQVLSQVTRMKLDIDVLVNNAGFGLYGPFSKTSMQTELDMIQLNISSLTELTKLFLPQMIQRGSGRILNLSSTAAFQPGPLMAVYYATKAYVLSFSQAIGNELEGTGVTVTALCPGPTRTKFQDRSGLKGSRLFSSQTASDPVKVAKAGYDGMLAGNAVVIPGFANKFLNFIQRFLPRSTVVKFVRRMQEARAKD